MFCFSRLLRAAFVSATLSVSSLLPSTLTAAPLSPELASRKPEFINVQLSPDGTAIAYRRVGADDLMSLEILDLASGEKQGVAGTENADVGTFIWIDNRRLGMVLTKDKLHGLGMFVYDRKTGRLARVNEGVQGFVSVPRDGGNRVYVRSYSDEAGVLMEISTLVDLNNRQATSNMSAVRNRFPAVPQGIVLNYIPNVAGEPVLAVSFDEGRMLTFLLDREEESWSSLPLDPEETPILAVAEDDITAWVSRRTADGGSSIYRYDLLAQEWGEEVYHDSDYNLATTRLVLSRDGQKLEGVQYTRVRTHSEWFEDRLAVVHERLTAALEGYDIVLTDRASEAEKAIFVAVSSTEPGQYFLADLDTGAIQHVAASAPWLAGVPLSPTSSFGYPARDGLRLQAYLTLPATSDAKKPYPLIVLGHGGPWARDVWRYDGEVQFLASRGFAVLQPNYRGSTGFSVAVSETDRFDYRKMHDDVTDGVKALVKAGIADPDRLAIMGASFGGYLAVAGAAWEPDLYQVAITNVGVFDWEMRMTDQKGRSSFAYQWQRKHLGDDKEKIARFSPIHYTDNIRIPIFIAHGRKDPNVDISQSVRLERALKARDVPYETYYEKDSGHGFGAAEAQAAYLEAVDAFLQHYFFRP
ncbi:alpha/beta hydrolase family protein [Actomonas aquatica]|uniref:S9 family peptidase n=1 Tax=Actomonas aquatica TaxID=2866162 RepID=A0ABZ1CEI6_9BACT|nr:S9 family peptidase [Opitutus sp. WL0086]WRQ89780.1 S9 family peptidase [Opitutus sp. WL0086]